MDLKRILLPSVIESEEKLYYRRDGKVSAEPDGSLRFGLNGSVGFDTYFNGFSTGKWRKYTVVDKVQLILEFQGTFSVELVYQYLQSGEVKEEILENREISSAGRTQEAFDFGNCREEGIFAMRCLSLAEDGMIFGGRYVNEKLMPANLNVNIMVDICTFKREEYVYRNLNLLKEQILENPESPLYRHLYVHISDNAKTLDTSIADGTIVKVSPNKNAGGVGGFTRGIIEAMSLAKQRDISHVLLMDDDAMIEPASLEVTYSFLSVLKEEYQDYTLAGSIIQLNKPYLQYEEGAQWNQGAIEALKHKVDLREVKVLLLNEDESEKVEYAGWWYCCIPVSAIEKYGFPMPFFIKTDDVEYGLRLKPQIVLVNGIGVWHMAFSEKYSPHLEYYIKRNELTASAVHGSGAGVWPGLYKLLKSAAKAFLKGDAHTLCFLCRACRDFLEGPDFFLKTDAEELNQRLLDELKAEPARCWSHVPALLRALGSFALRYGEVRSEYQRRLPELVSGEFWQIRLGCGEEEHDQS